MVVSWENKLPMAKSALEKTWLYHEIGRCYLEMGEYETAEEYGEKSLAAAQEAKDEVWQLNATVLIAQSQGNMTCYVYSSLGHRTTVPVDIVCSCHLLLTNYL